MRARSGDTEGQGTRGIWLSCKNWIVTLAAWGHALSCWNNLGRFWCWKICTTWLRNTSTEKLLQKSQIPLLPGPSLSPFLCLLFSVYITFILKCGDAANTFCSRVLHEICVRYCSCVARQAGKQIFGQKCLSDWNNCAVSLMSCWYSVLSD